MVRPVGARRAVREVHPAAAAAAAPLLAAPAVGPVGARARRRRRRLAARHAHRRAPRARRREAERERAVHLAPGKHRIRKVRLPCKEGVPFTWHGIGLPRRAMRSVPCREGMRCGQAELSLSLVVGVVWWVWWVWWWVW